MHQARLLSGTVFGFLLCKSSLKLLDVGIFSFDLSVCKVYSLKLLLFCLLSFLDGLPHSFIAQDVAPGLSQRSHQHLLMRAGQPARYHRIFKSTTSNQQNAVYARTTYSSACAAGAPENISSSPCLETACWKAAANCGLFANNGLLWMPEPF